MPESPSAEAAQNPIPWWVPIWEFLIHAIVGTSLFLLIALPAVGLNLLIIQFQASLNLSPFLIWILHAVEYLILGSDFLLLIVFIIRSVSRTIKQL